MERITPFLLTGLCCLSLCTSQRKYVVFQMAKTWYEAQTYCRENCFDLATIDDMNEMQEVLKTVEGKYNDGVWFGLWKANTQSWHWSVPEKDFYREGEKSYLPWGSNPTYNCATYKQGSLYAIPCHHLKKAVCYDGDGQGVNNYFLTEAEITWTQALNYCRTNHRDLTSMRNEAEHLIVQNLTTGQEVWVGLFKDPWVWSDQTASSMRYWPAGTDVWSGDGEACGVLLKEESGRWGSGNCSKTYPFLCACVDNGSRMRVIKVKVSLQNSMLDLNEPPAQDSLLQQMMLKLYNNGADDLRYQWRKQPDGNVFVSEIEN